ncbi:hypothetical protein CBL_10116 [Carabus blaptoides fortunei]
MLFAFVYGLFIWRLMRGEAGPAASTQAVEETEGLAAPMAGVRRFPFATPTEWTRWSRRFERFRIASGLNNKPEEEQFNSLIYLMRDQADILISFNLTTEQAKQYETVMRLFKEHFIIRNNEFC